MGKRLPGIQTRSRDGFPEKELLSMYLLISLQRLVPGQGHAKVAYTQMKGHKVVPNLSMILLMTHGLKVRVTDRWS